MDFQAWFEGERAAADCSVTALAVRLAGRTGLSVPAVRNAATGKRVSAPTARILAAVTGGAVEWHTLCDPGPVEPPVDNDPSPSGDAARETIPE